MRKEASSDYPEGMAANFKAKRWGRIAAVWFLAATAAFGAPQLTPQQEAAAKAIGVAAARRQIIKETKEEAIALNAPVGLLGATWFMSRDDVQRLRPSAIVQAPDALAENAEVYQRPAVVHFIFDGDALLMVIVSFKGGSTDREFLDTQTLLAKDFGPAPEVAITKEFRLETRRQVQRFVVHHTLRVSLGVPVEQIEFYLKKRE